MLRYSVMRRLAPARIFLLIAITLLALSGCGGPGGESRFVFAPSPSESTVTVRLCFLSGIDQNPPALPSLAWSTASALLGPSSGKREQMLSQLGSIGASLNFAVGFDVTVIEGRCPASSWDQFVPAFCEMVCSDPADGLKDGHLLNARRGWLEHLRGDADAVAAAAFCGYPVWDSAHALPEEIPSTELKAFWRTNYTSGNYVLGITGSITEAAARSIDEVLQKRLPSGQPKRSMPTPVQPEGLNVRVIGSPSDSTVTFRLGRPANAQPSDTLTAVLALLKFHLADLRYGIMNQILRDERGLVAGVDVTTHREIPAIAGEPEYEDITPDDMLCISTEVKPVNAFHTLRIILKELADAIDAGFSEERLAGLRRMVHSDSANAGDLSARVSRRLSETARMMLGYPSGERLLDAMKPADIRRYLHRVLDPEQLQIVAVCPDANALSTQILNGPISYEYPPGADLNMLHRDDQEYFSFRPFWQASKMRVEQVAIPPAESK